MPARIALMAARHHFEGPWWRARAGDSGVRVTGLGQNESITLEGDHTTKFTADDLYPITLTIGHRYRFIKVACGEDPQPTTVEIIST